MTNDEQALWNRLLKVEPMKWATGYVSSYSAAMAITTGMEQGADLINGVQLALRQHAVNVMVGKGYAVEFVGGDVRLQCLLGNGSCKAEFMIALKWYLDREYPEQPEIRPCIYCGGKTVWTDYEYDVGCMDCCYAYGGMEGDTKEKIIAAHNALWEKINGTAMLSGREAKNEEA